MRLRLRVGKIFRTVVLAAVMTGAMALTAFLGLIPASLIGGLVYVGGLFALRIVNREELRSLTRRGETRDRAVRRALSQAPPAACRQYGYDCDVLHRGRSRGGPSDSSGSTSERSMTPDMTREEHQVDKDNIGDGRQRLHRRIARAGAARGRAGRACPRLPSARTGGHRGRAGAGRSRGDPRRRARRRRAQARPDGCRGGRAPGGDRR